MEKEILNYLKQQTELFDFNNQSDLFTAKKIAEKFSIKRNTASHYLNQLVKEELIVKIKTRPVIFFHRKTFEKENFYLDKTIFDSFDELKETQLLFTNQNRDSFSPLIGANQSLEKSIQQLKVAALYPSNKLPFLLTGESGTGKSYMVQLFYQYCIANNVLKKNAPFLTLNCAQYANNPELLTSNLFGYAKGAFTGAEEDYDGLFKSADGGLLFLDEVHRLNAEGQEKLFTYMDQGVIQRIGETAKSQSVNVRLAFATTEDLQSTFLTTFIRRIPIQVKLPTLSQRTAAEIQELIYTFFIKESEQLDRELSITPQVIRLIKNNSFKGNVGELKNRIKYLVAKAYARQQDTSVIHITIHDLPTELLSYSADPLMEQEDQMVISINKTTVVTDLLIQKDQQKLVLTAYQELLFLFQKMRKAKNETEKYEKQMNQVVDTLFDQLIFKTNSAMRKEWLSFITQSVSDILKEIEISSSIQFNGNSIYAISYHLFQRRMVKLQIKEWTKKQLLNAFTHYIKKSYSVTYQYSQQLIEKITKKLDIEMNELDTILLTLYLKNLKITTTEQATPKAVIIAHGYSTASSIANVVNRLLNKNLFDSFDMPIDVTPQIIGQELRKYIEKNDVSNGLILLVDMGSLEEIHRLLKINLPFPIVLINNVSTRLALTIGEKLSTMELESLIKEAVNVNNTEYTMIYPDNAKPKVIITTCQTGIGTAKQLSKLLKASLPDKLNITILSYDYETLKENKEKIEVFSTYQVMAIIGTENPGISSTPYFSLDELVLGNNLSRLQKIFEQDLTKSEQIRMENQFIKNFSLEQVIHSVTILDTDKIIKKVEEFLTTLEVLEQKRIANQQKITLYVHLSCLIERLIRNMPIEVINECQEQKRKRHKEQFERIAQAFSVIEDCYSVKLPLAEQIYIYNILYGKWDQTNELSNF